jgi:N-acetylmuramoyl-L-alanine amidase
MRSVKTPVYLAILAALSATLSSAAFAQSGVGGGRKPVPPLSGPAPRPSVALSGLRTVAQTPGAVSSQIPATALPPRIVYGGVALPVPNPSAVPYRDPEDGILYVSPEALSPIGIVFIYDEKMGKVMLTTMSGAHEITVDARKPPEGSSAKGIFVPAIEVITALGGKCEWKADNATLYARSVLTGVEMIGGQLRIAATLPILPTVKRDGSRKIIVDIPGAEVGAVPKTLELNAPNVSAARSGQFNDDTARVVLEMKEPTGFTLIGSKPETQVALNPIAEAPAPVTIAAVPKKPSTKNATSPTVVKGITVKTIGDQRVQLIVSAGRTPTTRLVQNATSPNRITLDILNATLGANAAASLSAIKHPFLQGAQFISRNGNALQMVLDLTRVVAPVVIPNKDGTVIVDLKMPKSAGGRLAGKLIVVDAGHGGHDNGARGVNGTYEKNVNLGIAMQLADTLRDAGANVMLTRADDFFIPVNGRPKIANNAGADFFVSVHADDPGNGSRSHNGSTVYFHGNDANCKALAMCISARFEQMGGIRSKGVKTDYIRFPGEGYGVLRNSRMVAVLVECGFMTNPNDVRLMNDPEWRKRIAGAIAAGLRDYIEGNPDLDTRNNQPGAGGDVIPPLPTPPVGEPGSLGTQDPLAPGTPVQVMPVIPGKPIMPGGMPNTQP